MPYDHLARKLTDRETAALTTLPDGSLDHFCTVVEDGDRRIESREAFARAVLDERDSLRFRVDTVEPGGQAVNAAMQLHALGDSVTCYGHLEAPAFESLPFQTVSMGDPSDVYVFTFDDRDLMLARNTDLAEWTVADLEREADLSTVFAVDGICCSNWVSTPGLERAFHRLGRLDVPRVPFVFDPGDVTGHDAAEIKALHRAMATLQDTFDVVYNANRAEVEATAAPLSGTFDDDLGRLAAIREETGIAAAVMHARDEAAAATPDGRERVPNYRVQRPERHTGGGDRFTGGLAHALACGWDWDVALAMGNACAVAYVASGTSGDVDDLVEFLSTRGTDI
ncbi:MAG: carbohydrate kinase family protein [Haloarculaceae archaeon]